MNRNVVSSRFAAVFVAIALLGFGAAPALAGVVTPVDNYVCHKAKDLKIPSALLVAPASASLQSIISLNTCEFGKLAQVCLPAYVESAILTSPMVAQCCYKVKCTDDVAVTPFDIVDGSNGSPTFSGRIETAKKISLMCLACPYSPAP